MRFHKLLKTKTLDENSNEVYNWITLILILVIAGLLTYGFFSVYDSFQRVDEGLLVHYTGLQKATVAILSALVVYALCRRLDPLLARQNFSEGFWFMGQLTVVLWCVLSVVSIPAVLLVWLAQFLLSPYQQSLGPLYSIIVWGIGIATALVAGWLFLRGL